MTIEIGDLMLETDNEGFLIFPYGYGQQVCKIAGMRKPLKLMLDM